MERSKKPVYIDPAGDCRRGALPAAPPFVFRAVTSRVFPLKANMARLSGFCDQYLNMDIPARIARFRPSLPYVYLMLINYGSMSAASVEAQNVGWVSQHELTFTVPLEWWREEQGKLVFKDWACVSPFIFVDDEMSLTTGREVYGWPKVAAHIDADVPLWTRNPQSGDLLLRLSSHVFPKVYAGETETSRVLLEIERAAEPRYSTFPPDPTNPWAPLRIVADAVGAGLGLAGEALDMMLGARVRGYSTTRSPASMWAMFGKAGSNLSRLLPDLPLPWPGQTRETPSSVTGSPRLGIEMLTFKQFRAAENPNDACYQALVTSRMGFDRLNQAGLLGDLNLLRGDPSGGFTIRIHRYASQPFIESLGLDVVGESESSDGASVAILRPTLPFWTDVDLHYGKGRVICSRTAGCAIAPDETWVDEQSDAQGPPQGSPPPPTPDQRAPIAYNTALGAATQPVSGPFTFPDVTMQVFPLLAERAQLDRFVGRYVNDALESIDMRFETFGSYVYMLVTVVDDQLGTMWSSSNNIGWWAGREVAFAVPVKWYHRDELVSLGMLTPFVYANNGRAVITDREVNGRPTVCATIDQPPDAWLTRSGPVAERSMLRLDTEMFPALNLGQRAAQRTLLEIDGRLILPYNAEVEWRMVAQTWGERMVEDLKRKAYERATRSREVDDARALALELLANELPVNSIVLKQYRDASDTSRACYQAMVRVARSITHIFDVREIEERLHVRVHKCPGHPIVEALGLMVKSVDSAGGNVVENLQPVRPFWMRMAVKEDLGKVIAWRAADEQWTVTDPWFAGPVAAPQAADDAPYFREPREIGVGAALGQSVFPQNLGEQARHWLRQALVQELAWMQPSLLALSTEALTAVRERLPEAYRDQLGGLRSADPFFEYCDALPIDALIALARAARPSLSPPPLDPLPHEVATSIPRTWGERKQLWASRPAALERLRKAVEELPAERWTALKRTLPAKDLAEIERLRTASDVVAYCAETQQTVQEALFVSLCNGFDHWWYRPEELQRLALAEARQAIDALDEVQLVIESILSSEWENWGAPRWYRKLPPKPDQCVPVGSLLLGSPAGFAREHGLKTFEDNWWYVDPPKPEGGDK